MLTRILLISIILTVITPRSFAEFAVLPYRVNNPSSWLKADTGIEYARLLSAGTLIKKRVEVHSPEQIILDMKRMGLTPDSNISSDHLKRLGSSLYLDYILIGSLTKKGDKFISESILFSVKEGKVLAGEKNSASTLLKLAEADINSFMVLYPDKLLPGPAPSGREADILFLIDSSSAAMNDRNFINESILSHASWMIDDNRCNTRIYVVPFAEKKGREGTGLAENSIPELKKILSGVRPLGPQSGQAFQNSFTYAVSTVKWRPKALKEIVIITASNLDSAKNAQSTALTASRKGIKVHALKIGGLTPVQSKNIDAVSRVSGGTSAFVPYHRKVYDAAGEEISLYYEGGRAFRSWNYVSDWHNGLYEGQSTAVSMKIKPLYEEILDSAKEQVTPWNMSELYDRYGTKRIISIKPVESGLSPRVRAISAGITQKGSDPGNITASPRARVLLSDGKISVWADISTGEQLEIFKKRAAQKFLFPVALTLRKAPAETYGVAPVIVAADIPSDYIPLSMKVSLESLLKQPSKYLSNGIFTPPVWFIEVRVEEISGDNESDIRDTLR
jgi:hypothetical protein